MVDRVVVLSDDSAESGGAASIMLGSLRLLRARGVKITLITGDNGRNPELAALDVEVMALGNKHILEGNRVSAALRGLYSAKTSKMLRHWIERFDNPGTVYHLHNWHKVLSPSVFGPMRQVAQRLVVSAHDYFIACPNGGYFNFPQQAVCDLTPMHLTCILSSCDKRHYGHKLWRVARQAVRSSVFDFGNTTATILAVHEGMIPHLKRGGIDEGAIRVLRNPVTPWKSLRVAAEKNRDILYVGRLELDKGVDVLAGAAEQAKTRLRIVGRGALEKRIAREHPNVELMGQKTKAEIAEIVGNARLLVLPTRVRETFGLVALEGLMSGLPVIVSESALIAPEIEGLGIGRVCRVGDINGLAELLARFTDDDTAVAEMSRKAFSKARHLAPTPQQWCDALLQIYESKLEESGRPRQIL